VKSKPEYANLRVAHGKDRCANPPRSGPQGGGGGAGAGAGGGSAKRTVSSNGNGYHVVGGEEDGGGGVNGLGIGEEGEHLQHYQQQHLVGAPPVVVVDGVGVAGGMHVDTGLGINGQSASI